MNRLKLNLVVLIGLFLLTSGCASLSTGANDVTAAKGVTMAKVAGTWDYVGSGTVIGSNNNVCGVGFTGTATISQNGDITLDQADRYTCALSTTTGSVTGKGAVARDGSGTITLSGSQTIIFQVSRDLNTIIFSNQNSYISGTALRR